MDLGTKLMWPSNLSYAYCLNPQNKNFNFNHGFPSLPYKYEKCWESNTLTEKEVENINVATHNFNSSAPLSSSYFYTLVILLTIYQ